MNRTSFRAAALGCALLSTTALTFVGAAPAQAQSAPTAAPAPYPAVDANGVDLVSGKMNLAVAAGSIGSGAGAVALQHFWTGSGAFVDNWSGGLLSQTSGGVTTWTAILGAHSDTFTQSGTTFTSVQQNGATLAISGTVYRYTAADGTVTDYKKGTKLSPTLSGFACLSTTYSTGNCYVPTSVTRTDGTAFALNWDFVDHCPNGSAPGPLGCSGGGTSTADYRFRGVSSSAGYGFTINYDSDSFPQPGWWQMTGVTFTNDVTACDSSCPSVTYGGTGGNIDSITDAVGQQWHFTIANMLLTGVRRPGATSDTTTIAYSGGAVSQVVRDGVTTGYARTVNGTTATTVVTTADGSHTVTADLTKGRITSVFDELGHTTSYLYDTAGRLTRATAHEGNYVGYTYDSRGNVTKVEAVPKGGSGATITTEAAYDASCASTITCNKPNSTTDARGNITTYQWNSTHGQLDWVRAPAASSGATQPETRYSYTLTASPVGQGSGTYLLTGVSSCQTLSSCASTADEVKSTITYGANLLPTGTSSGAGNGSLTASNLLTYDPAGNLLTVDGPLAGSADTTRYRYDAGRRLVGIVSPDPDGAGSLKPRAVRNTYTNGLVTKVEQGNVNSQSDSDWTGFTSAQAVETTYDANARPMVTRLTIGSSIYTVSQTSYDALGRPDCVAQRMNLADFALPPTNVCAQGTSGSIYGPDRIGKTRYDPVGRISGQSSGYDTADVSDDATLTYTANGQVETITDARGNMTTYEYDGHDRLAKTRYPTKTSAQPPVSASGDPNVAGHDYEQLVYETTAGGARTSATVASVLNRAGETIAFSYDALGRLAFKDLPGSEPDVTYAYDLLDRMTGASQTGHALTFSYDALGRKLSETGPRGSMSWAWDLAGRRTRFTFQDGFYVDYDYLVTGELSHVYETNGAGGHVTSGLGVLATYAYDDLGRRTAVARGNGTSTAYAYTGPRLTSIAHDFAGTTDDLTLGLVWNPAGQIQQTTRSNDAYAWTRHGSGSTTSTPNGLNQITASGSATLTYDAKGNLTSDGTSAYTYSSENRLLTGPNTTFSYDPLGRLYGLTNTSYAGYSSTFLHDGGEVAGEYNAGGTMPGLALNRRYVHSDRADEEIGFYYLSPTSSTRYWYHQDERGSPVGMSGDAGAAGTKNGYDEYGRMGATNWGRIQYTGQIWLAVPDLYYYKNRMYDAKLGRFLQPDPIGYGDGMNIYGYVGGDPVNLTDPSGLCAVGEHEVHDTGSRIPRCVKNGSGDEGGLAGGFGGFSSAGTGGRSGGHYEVVKGHGSAATGTDGEQIISAYRVWVADAGSTSLGSRANLQPRPAYCHSIGYAIGDFIDKQLGGTVQDVGAITVVGGVAIGAATAITGVGAGAGAAVAGAGATTYAFGTSISAIGNGIKWLSGQDAGVTAGAVLSIPTMRMGPVSQVVTEKVVSYLVGQSIRNPCDG
jgi:RHS repeat-associated protein